MDIFMYFCRTQSGLHKNTPGPKKIVVDVVVYLDFSMLGV